MLPFELSVDAADHFKSMVASLNYREALRNE
jgi:hypothetical protein